jgi:polyhydroxybutyrate depolymerase
MPVILPNAALDPSTGPSSDRGAMVAISWSGTPVGAGGSGYVPWAFSTGIVVAMATRCRLRAPTGGWHAVVIGALLAVGPAACGDDGTADSGQPTASTRGADPAPPASECGDGALNGRTYILCTSGDEEQGLVVALHARQSSPQELQDGTELHAIAAERGIAVVYPQGVDARWGDDTFTTSDRPEGDEDVVHLDRLVAELRQDPRIGAEPIGIVGYSNGAGMALRYAAERPDMVRAAVAVAGQLASDPAVRPSGRVPLLAVHGTADELTPFDTGRPEVPDRGPGDPTPTLSTADTVAAFVSMASGAVAHEGPDEIDPAPDDGTRVRTERWVDEAGTVAVLRTVVEGGHTWPSARGAFSGGGLGPISQDIDASADTIAFIVDPDAFV